MIVYKNKSEKLKGEFNSDNLSALLRGCALDLGLFAKRQWEKSLTITSIYRSGITQVNLCKTYTFKSRFRHCIWSAIDLRTSDLTIDQTNELERYVRNNWKRLCHLKVHRKGTGQHMHLELDEAWTDLNKLWKLISNTKEARNYFVG